MTRKKPEKLIKVPYIDQTEEWPTGCESVSAVMFLQYLGINITVGDFVERFLERKPLFEKDGKLYGPNPWKVFAGEPADKESMGCYAPVIVKAVERVFQAEAQKCSGLKSQAEEKEMASRIADYEVVNLTETPMETLLREYIDNDIPVIFWASIDLKETYSGPDWILTDSEEIFTWRSNEHCMLLVGYDEEKYYFNDPWHGHGTIGYEKKLVEKRHAEQYSMAVSVRMRV